MERELSEKLFHEFKDPLVIVDALGSLVHKNEAVKDHPEAEEIMKEISQKPAGMDKQYLLLGFNNQDKHLYETSVLSLSDKHKAVLLRKTSLNEEPFPFGAINKGSREGVVVFDDEKIHDCDSRFAGLFNKEPEEIIGKNIRSLFPFLSHKEKGRLLSPEVKKEFEMLGKTALPGAEEAFIMAVREEELHEEVLCPGLYGRKTFVEEVQNLINHDQSQGIAVFALDLDDFRQINDTFGYQFGEKLIRECGNRLQQLMDDNIFIGHLGGDEFFICLYGTRDYSIMEQLAYYLLEQFRLPFVINQHEITLTLRIGISTYPAQASNSDELLRQADSAMYQLKEKRTNDYQFYSASITESFEALLSMEADLSKAEELNEFEVHYQPQTNIETGEIIGCEALLRWNHTQKGYIPPDVFIPVLEKNNQISVIGEWILNKACQQNKRWQEEGLPPMVMSVNLSAKQLYNSDLLQTVKRALALSGLEPHYLELEITESMAMTNETVVLKTLQQLRNYGVRISIDDFGTGYSSLQYLSRFPVNKLKIDKVFLHENPSRNEAIVKSIIHMSHALNMKVIAEGIETKAQLEFLRAEKCDEGQGFLFSKPLPAEETGKWLIGL